MPTDPQPPSIDPIPEPTGRWPCTTCGTSGCIRHLGMPLVCRRCQGKGGWGAGFFHKPALPAWLPYPLARWVAGGDRR